MHDRSLPPASQVQDSGANALFSKPILLNKAVKTRERRRRSLLALTVLLMSGSCRETTTDGPAMTVFVVRHAEYADDGSDNPGLSEMGFNRARRLSDHH